MKSITDKYVKDKENVSEIYLKKYKELYDYVRSDNNTLRNKAVSMIEKLDTMLELQENFLTDDIMLEIIESQEKISKRISDVHSEIISTKSGDIVKEELYKIAKKIKYVKKWLF